VATLCQRVGWPGTHAPTPVLFHWEIARLFRPAADFKRAISPYLNLARASRARPFSRAEAALTVVIHG
jgi:hypothetical protein